ncbi:MAG: cobalt ECF transporter T component CbiQ [Candidatus Omnitrophica bacterium]|nr:cobalt ECF transporter T component CbiQ [Candidatus Omnitrophota bacterium]
MKFSHHNFIQRAIIKTINFFKESIFAQEYALQKGFLQWFPPQVKIISVLAVIVGTLLTKSIALLFVFYLICLLIASLSKIKIGYFLKRTWLFIPIFSFFIALPAFFTDFNIAVLFVTRVLVSTSYIILLSLTTPHTRLLKTLRSFGVPQVFVMTLGMCYRYIFLFAEVIENTYLAVKSRVGGAIHYKHGQHIATWRIASLWQRSLQLNREIYDAMLSRGYSGEPRVLDE